MSAENALLRAEMEVKPRLQNAIVGHHIIQVVSAVFICIVHSVELEISFFVHFMILILFNVPTVLFIIFWFASKCSYRDLRLILVHFNPCLSILWFLVYFPYFIIHLQYIDGTVTIALVVIFSGFISLSSAIFATYGIWKSARKVVLSSRRVKREDYDVLASLPPTVESPDMYTDINVQRLSQARNFKKFKTQLLGSALEYYDQSTQPRCSVPYTGYPFDSESNTTFTLCATFH